MIMPREFAFARQFFSVSRPFYEEHPTDVEDSSEESYYSSLYFHGPSSAFAAYKTVRHDSCSEPLELTTPPPLDLSFKSSIPITPPSTPSPSSHTKKKTQETPRSTPQTESPKKIIKIPLRKHKAIRKLNFDEDKTSPVSGTIIRELRDDEPPLVVRKGDIDPAYNLVEVTEEAKAELAKIENKIGDYICRLCKEMYEDAFTLAQHRCSRIVHVEYRCPECDKVFNCPANLASHRRWHKPRTVTSESAVDLAKKIPSDDCDSNNSEGEAQFPCVVCHKRFRRQAYLRKHLVTHQTSPSYSPTPQQDRIGAFGLHSGLTASVTAVGWPTKALTLYDTSDWPITAVETSI